MNDRHLVYYIIISAILTRVSYENTEMSFRRPKLQFFGLKCILLD
jgi:hypothetical protein